MGGTIATITRGNVRSMTVQALLRLDASGLGDVHMVFIEGGLLPHQRNEAIQHMRGDWILFIDDDMVFAPDSVRRLVAFQQRIGAEIVGGLYFERMAPHEPTMYQRVDDAEPVGPVKSIEVWERGAAVDVDATGAGFLLIQRRALEAIAGAPLGSYEERTSRSPHEYFRWIGDVGEDVRFCLDARAAGCRIMVDTSIAIGHVGELVVTEIDYLRSAAYGDLASVLEKRREINDAAGLATLEPKAADEILRDLEPLGGWPAARQIAPFLTRASVRANREARRAEKRRRG
jgi:GT2 family glycosyltransferase